MASTTASSSRLAEHALNRLAFGPRPGEAERLLSEGVDRWIERQLAAGAPDETLPARLSGCPAAGYTAAQIILEHQTMNFSRAPIEGALADLRAAKLIRAVHAENQLAEVLTDFWYNHFNVYAYAWEPSVPAFEREAIRPHALGRFRALLGAVSAHPAMLFYLDNYLSTAPRPKIGGEAASGLNENYGRELLELHTVGVDAGYTQSDVVDSARAFTGWGIEGFLSGESPSWVFCYRDDRHDKGAKHVFGLSLPPGGGREDAEALLDHLAAHPATARFVARRLVQRFVSDDPPGELVGRAAAVFQHTQGDIRAVCAAVFASPEFRSPKAAASKPKTPFEFAVSAVRALDATVVDGRPLAERVADMGMPLYGCKPPTGYSNRGGDWLNPAAQIARFDFAVKLGAGQLPGVRPAAEAAARDPRAVALRLAGPAFQMR